MRSGLSSLKPASLQDKTTRITWSPGPWSRPEMWQHREKWEGRSGPWPHWIEALWGWGRQLIPFFISWVGHPATGVLLHQHHNLLRAYYVLGLSSFVLTATPWGRCIILIFQGAEAQGSGAGSVQITELANLSCLRKCSESRQAAVWEWVTSPLLVPAWGKAWNRK